MPFATRIFIPIVPIPIIPTNKEMIYLTMVGAISTNRIFCHNLREILDGRGGERYGDASSICIYLLYVIFITPV